MILIFYIGQVLFIKSLIRNYKEGKTNIKDFIKRVNVTTVDKYQEKENGIILLSLVRSNESFKMGFLRIFNIIGNFKCLIQSENELNKKEKYKKIFFEFME